MNKKTLTFSDVVNGFLLGILFGLILFGAARSLTDANHREFSSAVCFQYNYYDTLKIGDTTYCLSDDGLTIPVIQGDRLLVTINALAERK